MYVCDLRLGVSCFLFWKDTMLTEGKITYERMYSTINPMVESVFCIASECQMKGDYARAFQLYQEVIEKEPCNVKAFLSMGDVNDHLGNHAEAILWYDKALEYDPYNAEVWYNKGMTLRKMGANEEGLSCIRKGISLAMSAPSPRYRV